MFHALRLAVILTVAMAQMAGAAIIGVTGGGEIIAPPSDMSDDATTNTTIQGFDERQGIQLSHDLSVDDGLIAAGTWVNSHMLFLNSAGNTRVRAGLNGSPISFIFDGLILGIMSDRNGEKESASNAILGAISTLYPGSFKARGLETNSVAQTNDWYDADGSTLYLGMMVTEPGDWIRVITASPDGELPVVPAPAPAMLLGTGVIALLLVRRRKLNGV